jgi:hypothetical protein
VNKKLIDLAIAIFLDNLMLKIYFDGEAYTRTGVCVCVCVCVCGLYDKRGGI